MKSEKLKFISLQIARFLKYMSKNIKQGRIITLTFCFSLVILSLAASLSIVMLAGNVNLFEVAILVKKIIS